ncbi:unnamed protein product [Paramecium primaurelia]|uniref:Uncharacterized protein n=2 Tax=Paramecium TaxID=5884 RepID=A0A8S1YAN5_9CILI|nr:unnamed protein product [Paramecium primaurelia]CAD8211526.1 unnamed protein product [Paramecium pentaurelia]
MEQIDSIPGKLLCAIYMLSKSQQLSIKQKNHLKDLVIQQDQRMIDIIQEYLENKNSKQLFGQLLQISNEESFISDDCVSQTSNYKYRRPQMIILPNKKFELNFRKFSQGYKVSSEKSLSYNKQRHQNTHES